MKKFNDYRKFWKEVFIADIKSGHSRHEEWAVITHAVKVASGAVLKLEKLDHDTKYGLNQCYDYNRTD